MSIVVEETPLTEVPTTENLDIGVEQETQQDIIQEEVQAEADQPESIVPEKYAGKSLEDVPPATKIL